MKLEAIKKRFGVTKAQRDERFERKLKSEAGELARETRKANVASARRGIRIRTELQKGQLEEALARVKRGQSAKRGSGITFKVLSGIGRGIWSGGKAVVKHKQGKRKRTTRKKSFGRRRR